MRGGGGWRGRGGEEDGEEEEGRKRERRKRERRRRGGEGEKERGGEGEEKWKEGEYVNHWYLEFDNKDVQKLILGGAKWLT